MVERYRFRCYAYCLMDNHYHLLLETPQGNLSRGMRQLNGVYTQAFNRRYRRSGTPGSTWQWWSTVTGWRR
jgi:REP element-mobilizing transposase RayT